MTNGIWPFQKELLKNEKVGKEKNRTLSQGPKAAEKKTIHPNELAQRGEKVETKGLSLWGQSRDARPRWSSGSSGPGLLPTVSPLSLESQHHMVPSLPESPSCLSL